MMFTPHFSEDEFDVAGAPANVRANAQLVAMLLERIRALGGGQSLVVTSGYRPGDARQHGTGSAADIRVPGRDPVAYANRVLPGLAPSEFGQIIVYPYTTRHMHVALANGSKRGEILVEVGKSKYARWQPGTPVPAWGSLDGTTSPDAPPTEGAATIQGLLLLLGLVAFLFTVLGA